MENQLTERQAAIVMAYTGITTCPFAIFKKYAEEKLGCSIEQHEFEGFSAYGLIPLIRDAAVADFVEICIPITKADEITESMG